MNNLNELSLAFTAGVVGAVANSLAVWVFGVGRLNLLCKINIAPALTAQWLYPRLVWGGLWGLLFATPLLEDVALLERGLWLSLGPSLAQIFYFFPYQARQGVGGVKLGKLTPLFVLVVNAVWGLVAAWWILLARGASL